MIEGLLVGWIFNLFGFGKLFIKAMDELFGLKVTLASYYLFFFVLGTIYDFLKVVKKR